MHYASEVSLVSLLVIPEDVQKLSMGEFVKCGYYVFKPFILSVLMHLCGIGTGSTHFILFGVLGA